MFNHNTGIDKYHQSSRSSGIIGFFKNINLKFVVKRCAAEILDDFISTSRQDGDTFVGVREINFLVGYHSISL
jgi:hypothetical protein